MEIIPIVSGQASGYDPAAPAVVNFYAGPNRWAWSVTQGGTIIQQQDGAYGEFTG
jgi:hypothetical protein